MSREIDALLNAELRLGNNVTDQFLSQRWPSPCKGGMTDEVLTTAGGTQAQNTPG